MRLARSARNAIAPRRFDTRAMMNPEITKKMSTPDDPNVNVKLQWTNTTIATATHRNT